MAYAPDPQPLPYAGGLAPYAPSAELPWTAHRAAHLLRRTGVGAPPEAVARVLAQSPRAAVAALIAGAHAAGVPPDLPLPPLVRPGRDAPDDVRQAYREAAREGVQATNASVFEEALGVRHPGSPLREKLALAWHARVPVRRTHHWGQAWAYWQILRRHALGSYRELIREVGTTPSMLMYLNGVQNRASAPNENYARELLELFTTGRTGPDGRPPYTQADVSELARAFTGWVVPTDAAVAEFRPRRADRADKTVFGVTGSLDASTAVDLIFQERGEAVAAHVARHLYGSFVSETANEQVVGELAARLLADDFEVAGAVEALLASTHFFAATTLGARIKSPYEHALGLAVDVGAVATPLEYRRINARAVVAGYDRLAPDSVAGWAGGRAWLDTSRLNARWDTSDRLLSQYLRRLRIESALLRETPGADDPERLVDALTERLFAVPLSGALRAEAVAVLLGDIPAYEWTGAGRGAEARVRALLTHLARLPEYQLT